MMDESLSGPLGRIIFKGAKVKNPFADVGSDWIIGNSMRRMWKAGFKGSAKHMGATALRYTTANFAEGIPRTYLKRLQLMVFKTYFKSLYDAPMGVDLDVKLAEMTESLSRC